MLPSHLVPESFQQYPPKAKDLASSHVAVLRMLPLAFVPLLLRELIIYDWKFPTERKEIDRQFAFLTSILPADLMKAMAPFAQLQLTPALEKIDWINSPTIFSEKLTAHLWATHQINRFRSAATEYMTKASAMLPEDPLPMRRLGIVVIGQGVEESKYRLFRKLRPHGSHFVRINHSDGLGLLIKTVAKRVAEHQSPYSHWYIDGGAPVAKPPGVIRVSYDELSQARAILQARMMKSYQASVFDPEAFRTSLALTKVEDIGLNVGNDEVINRFALSLLTQGSGTQIYATTFVQWAAREALRRAQPLTMLTRFTPRQREKPMNELLAEAHRRPELDPHGSLIDADMGAYYTWLNQQRLPGSDKSSFLVWFENHSEAIAIGGSFDRNKSFNTPITLQDIVERLI